MVEPIDRVRTTAFKERTDIINKVNELIEGVNEGEYQGATVEQFNAFKDEIIPEVENAVELSNNAVTLANNVQDYAETQVDNINDNVQRHSNQIADLYHRNTALGISIDTLSSTVQTNTNTGAELRNDLTELESTHATDVNRINTKTDSIDSIIESNLRIRDGTNTRLGTGTFGSPTNPIYINNGVPTPVDYGDINSTYYYESDGTHNGTWIKAVSGYFVSADLIKKRIHIDIVINDSDDLTIIKLNYKDTQFGESDDSLSTRLDTHGMIKICGNHPVSLGVQDTHTNGFAFRFYVKLYSGTKIRIIKYSDDEVSGLIVFDTESTTTFVGDSFIFGQLQPTTQFLRSNAVTNKDYIILDTQQRIYDCIRYTNINNISRVEIKYDLMIAVNHSNYVDGVDVEPSICISELKSGIYNGPVFIGSQTYTRNNIMYIIDLYLEPRSILNEGRIPLRRITHAINNNVESVSVGTQDLIVITPNETMSHYADFDFSNSWISGVSGIINNGAIYYKNPSKM